MAELKPAGIRALTIAVPSDRRDITLPSGQSAVRHFLSDGVTGLDLEREAAEQALQIAGLEPGDVDLVLSASFPALPEPCIGNATPLAYAMGMKDAAAYNLESACASGLIALRTACQEVMLGEYKNVLLTVVCPYSPTIEPGHPATTVIGDAAYAMVVGETAPGQEFLGGAIRNSGPTCDLVAWGVSPKTASGIRLEVGAKTAGQLEDWAQEQLPDLSRQLFERTGVSREDVDHWVLNAPTPSFVDRTLLTLGASPRDGVNINRLLGNIGPSLIGASLFYSAHLRGFKPGDLILCCSVGSEASLAIALMRWPEGVALGEAPASASLEEMRRYEEERLAAA